MNLFWHMFNFKTIKIGYIIVTIHAKQSNEFQLIHTHQDLSYMPHPLLF